MYYLMVYNASNAALTSSTNNSDLFTNLPLTKISRLRRLEIILIPTCGHNLKGTFLPLERQTKWEFPFIGLTMDSQLKSENIHKLQVEIKEDDDAIPKITA